MSIKLKDTIYDLINNSDKLDGKDSSAFSLTTHTHSQYLTELPSHTHNYASTVKIGNTSYNSNDNVISLPTYPTLNSLGAAPASHTHDYLPLSGGTLTGPLTIKSSTTSGDTPKLYFQRGTETDSYYDNYIYNTGGGLTFGYSNGGTNYDLVKVTSTTLRPNENNKYDLGSETYKWKAIYSTSFIGTATSVSKSLKFGDKTYNGSAEETITAADLGAVTLTGTQYISGAKYFQRDAANGLYIENTGETNTSRFIAIRFRHSGANVSGIASSNTTDSYLYRINAAYSVTYKIWDEGNFTPSNYLLLSSYTALDVLTKLKTVDGSGSGLDADLLDGKQPHELSVGFLKTQYSNTTSWYDNYLLYGKWATDNSSICDFKCDNYSVRVDIAKKLNTARTIWGQSFDGTGNITGRLNITSSLAGGMTQGAGALCIGPLTGGHLMVDTNDIQAKADGTTPTTLYINDWGGNVAFCSTSGNVGIGITSPKGKLHVEGNSYLRGTIYVTNPDATTINEGSGKIKFNSINADDTYRSPYIQAINESSYSRKRLGIFQSNAANYTDDFVEVLSIKPNGNVGIGTTSPAYKLRVNGSLSCSTFYIGEEQITFIT